MADGTLKFDTSLDTGGFQQGVGKLGSIAQNALGVFAGNLMTKAVDGLVNIGKEAISLGGDFEYSMAKVHTLFTGTNEDFAGLNDTVLKLSNTYGISAQEMAEAAYSAESASVSQENLGAMMEGSAKLAVAGFTDVQTALTATASTMNAYGMTSEEELNKVQKVLIQTQNLGITTVDELGHSLSQVTPTAAAFGVSFDQVGASLATMTAQGTPTAQATTQLNSLLAELGKEGTTASNNLMKAAEGSKWAGMSFTEMQANGATLTDVLGLMAAQADKDGVSLLDMFSSVEAGKGALSLFSGEGEVFKANLAEMGSSTDVLGDSFNTMADTTEFNKQRIITTLQNMAIGVFQAASGPLADGLQTVQDSLDRLVNAYSEGGLSGLLSETTNVLGELGGQLGSGLIGLMNGAADSIKNFDWIGASQSVLDAVTGFIEGGGLQQFISSAATLIAGFASGIGQALPRLIQAGVKIITTIVGAIISNLPQLLLAAAQLIAGLLVGLALGIDELITSLGTWFGNILTAVITFLGTILTSVITWFTGLVTTVWNWLLQIITSVIQWGAQMVTNAATAMSQMLTAIITWVSQLPEQIWTWLVNVVTNVLTWGSNMISTASTAMSDMLSKIIEWVSMIPGRVMQWLSETLSNLLSWGSNMVSRASSAMSNMLSGIINYVSQIPGRVASFLSETLSNLATFASNMVSKATEAASGFFNAIVNGLSSLPGRMLSIGSDIVNGLWNGISNGWSWLTDQVSNLAHNLLSTVTGALKIGSPSRRFRDEVGRWIPPGIAIGVEHAMPEALDTVKEQARNLVATMKAGVDDEGFNFVQKSKGRASGLLGGGGTTVYNDNHVDQTNTYNVPTATPSEVNRAQREAVRKLVGGIA